MTDGCLFNDSEEVMLSHRYRSDLGRIVLCHDHEPIGACCAPLMSPVIPGFGAG